MLEKHFNEFESLEQEYYRTNLVKSQLEKQINFEKNPFKKRDLIGKLQSIDIDGIKTKLIEKKQVLEEGIKKEETKEFQKSEENSRVNNLIKDYI